MLGKNKNEKKMSIQNKIEIYNKPKKVYIPLINGIDDDVTILVKKGDMVKLGEMIAKTKGDLRIPFLASISGKVIDIKNIKYTSSKEVKCIVIENDYDSELNSNPINKTYSKQEFIDKLQEKGIIGTYSSYPTYAKYNNLKKIKTLIINALETEPYITSDYMITKLYCEEILEAIDMIMEINGIKESIIAINKDEELKSIFDSYLGTYPNIKLKELNNKYTMGYERLLVKEVKGENYNLSPIEKGIVVNNISTIYAIYKALKYDNPLVERVITLTGLVDKPLNVLVRIGTPIKDIINNFGKYNKDLIYVTSTMRGEILDIDSVVGLNLTGVIALKKESDCSLDCINCGKCVMACPRKLSPVLIKDNLNNIKELKKLKAKRCVECGMCSYVCPAKIDVREKVKEAKNKLGGI